ncbi:hypothetical protein FOA52_011826 [Chlamydomonas sp. UWO 241]|nr:hypothetical protein FOA52_011826 [Chlamydomonas sp. UWO 241]
MNFLFVHYCTLAGWPSLSFAVQTTWLLTMFTVMLVACDRFFCPSIERLSEWLQLSPAVAGATLLAFGNGATDLFTQIAMVMSGRPGQGFELALTEPLGTGMFVTNVIVAAIILITPQQRVKINKVHFMKDILFFFGAVTGVLLMLLKGSIQSWQAVIPAAYYVTYIIVTVVLAREQEPLHADPRRHEIPMWRSTSFLDTARTAVGIDLYAVAPACAMQVAWERSPSLLSRRATSDTGGHQGPLSAADLAAVTEGLAHVVTHLENDLAAEERAYTRRSLKRFSAALAAIDSDDELGCGAGGGTTTKGSPPSLVLLVTEGVSGPTSSAPSKACGAAGEAGTEAAGEAGRAAGAPWRTRVLGWLVSAWWEWVRRPVSDMLSLTMPLVSNRANSSAYYPKVFAVALPLTLPPTLAAYWGGLNVFTADWAHNSTLQTAWRHTQKALAAYWGGLDGFTADWAHSSTLHASALACVACSGLLALLYPVCGTLRGPLLGACTGFAFVGSMVWMRFAAEEVVAVTVCIGTIFEIPSPLLAATFLSWAGAAGDTVSNLALARDGFPTMALTACFSSPLFVLLGGLTCTLVYFAQGDEDGIIDVPRPDELLVLYGSCMVVCAVWVIAMPLLFRYKLNARTAVMALTMYLLFQLVYIFFAL